MKAITRRRFEAVGKKVAISTKAKDGDGLRPTYSFSSELIVEADSKLEAEQIAHALNEVFDKFGKLV